MGNGVGNGHRLGCRDRGSLCSAHCHSSADTTSNPKVHSAVHFFVVAAVGH